MSKSRSKVPGKEITFLHPDLGLGGAERLIVDAAVGLQEKGYQVSIITGYHDPNRAFPETVNGTLEVVPVGRWIPRTIFGRLVALCAYFQMAYAAVYLTLFSRYRPGVVICDQVSACIPFLRLRWNIFSPRPKVMFYCHFPDQLLTERKTLLKRLYRWPIDAIEQYTTSMADKIVVNSLFTRTIFQETFRRIQHTPDILYPSINYKLFDKLSSKGESNANIEIPKCEHLFISINRFEPKKNIELVIKSLKKLKACLTLDEWKSVHLVVAGGYDERLESCVTYLSVLKKLVCDEKMDEHVTFTLSPSDAGKVLLIKKCTALIYTPSNEHFGIVPLEAMYMGKPVVAVDSGGPRETVVNEVTGFLCPAINTHFGVAMARFVKEPELAKRMGQAGKHRYMEKFSFEAFKSNWASTVETLHGLPRIEKKKTK